jgi:hypothetical protein
LSGPRNEGGIPHRREQLTGPPGETSREETWAGANEAKNEKLQRHSLERRARAQGLELRHSEYGYALLDPARNRIDDRNDLTLEEVESCLARS